MLNYSNIVLGRYNHKSGKEAIHIYYDKFIIIKNRIYEEVHSWSELKNYYHEVTNTTTSLYFVPIYTKTKHKLTLQLNDGKRFVFSNNYYEIEELATLLPKVTYDPLMLKVIKELKEKNNVTFREIAITMDGLAKGNKLLKWELVAAIEVYRGSIAITGYRSDNQSRYLFARQRFKDTPNPFVFEAFIHEYSPNIE